VQLPGKLRLGLNAVFIIHFLGDCPMKIVIFLLTALAAMAAAAFALRYNADRPDARDASPSAPRAHITCFSAGNMILDDFAAGDIDIRDSGAFQFRSRTTGKRITTTADCVAVYGATPAAGFKAVLP
jgi:hypothetical protein